MKEMRKILLLLFMLASSGCMTSRFVVRHEPTAERLGKVPVVDMKFEEIAMSDVVAALAENLHCVCHPAIYPEQSIKDDVIIYSIPFDTYDAHDPKCPREKLKGTNVTQMVQLGPAITLHARNVSMLDLIREITRLSRCSTMIAENRVLIRTRKVPPPSAQAKKESTWEVF